MLAKVEKSDCACFIELRLDPEVAPETLKTFGPLTAELDYGPRGPQRIIMKKQANMRLTDTMAGPNDCHVDWGFTLGRIVMGGNL